MTTRLALTMIAAVATTTACARPATGDTSTDPATDEGAGEEADRSAPQSVPVARTIAFRATVVVAPRQPTAVDAGRRAWLVGADPRWVVILRIEEILEGDAPFEAGSEQTFLIHSPSRVFPAGVAKRQRMVLRAGVVEGDPPRISSLAAEPE